MQGMYFLQLYSAGCPLKQPSALNFPDLSSLTKSHCGWYNEGKGNTYMTKNMGTVDRLVRIILAVIIVILLLNGSVAGTLALILGIFAVSFLGTSAIGWCPLYKPLNINTKKTRQKQDS